MNAPVGVYGPHPLAAAVIAAAVFAAIFLTCLALFAAAALRDWWRGRKHPAPGHPRPPIWRDAVTPPRQHAPAPGRHDHGPLVARTIEWACGCEQTYDGTGRLIWASPCQPPAAQLEDDAEFLARIERELREP